MRLQNPSTSQASTSSLSQHLPRMAGADAPPQESLQASGEVFSYVRQIYIDDLGPAGAEVLLRAALAAPSKMSCVILQHGGGVSRDAHAGSCVGCRKWEFSVLFMSLWDDASPEARQANEAWGRRARLEHSATS